MRLHIISDLHLEFDPLTLPAVEADVTVIAGDLTNGADGVRWLQKNIPDRPVLYVLGNHEFYGDNLPALIGRVRDLTQGTNVTLLENDTVRIGNVTFLGATLWTDFAFNGDVERAQSAAAQWMADYSSIKVGPDQRPLQPSHLLAIHQESRAWLQKTAAAIEGTKVIITHHAPHPKSITPKFLNSPSNPAFASDLTELIEAANAKLWIHGHTHSNSDYVIGKTRVVDNPRGYDLENMHFKPDWVIDLI